MRCPLSPSRRDIKVDNICFTEFICLVVVVEKPTVTIRLLLSSCARNNRRIKNEASDAFPCSLSRWYSKCLLLHHLQRHTTRRRETRNVRQRIGHHISFLRSDPTEIYTRSTMIAHSFTRGMQIATTLKVEPDVFELTFSKDRPFPRSRASSHR